MKLKYGVLVLLVFFLLALPACDNNDDNGGGVTPAAGYSNASLTGKWSTMTRRIKPGSSGWFGGTTIFDAAGQVSASRGAGLCWPGAADLGVISSELSVSSDGRITGQVTYRCPQPSTRVSIYQFDKVYFLDNNRIQGTLTIIVVGIEALEVEMAFNRR